MKKLRVNLFPHLMKKHAELGREVSSKEIAREIGMHQSTLSAYKNGKLERVQLSTLQKLAEYFSCQAGDLLSVEDEV